MSGIRNNHTAQIGINVKDTDGNVQVVTLLPGLELDLGKHGLTVVETPMYKARIEDKLLSTDTSGEEDDQQELTPATSVQQTEPVASNTPKPSAPQPASKPAAKPEAK